ncbi:uncharacterized protein LOC106177702 [Lingula anatina]|uniref:Uncharacterized protein LOC106177702 n=1 Tax=Lingula anatina TaxID=7574 RepID=A0A1S3K0C9_LINAN|nr:uncharacterized protein LOC106177702 [Lingula anatina]|eukprot:XP_013416002.1 uncharacterized protein LOC106177702 [Lingula anatina]
MCRKIDPTWVKEIKKGLKTSPVNHTVILPCLLLGDEDFDEAKLPTYKIVSLGGNHLRVACQQLLQECNENHLDCIRTIQVDLYHKLSLHQALQLANIHNLKNEVSQTTLQDQVRHVRKKLYSMTNTPEDQEPPSEPENFRRECLIELAMENLLTIKHALQIKVIILIR